MREILRGILGALIVFLALSAFVGAYMTVHWLLDMKTAPPYKHQPKMGRFGTY